MTLEIPEKICYNKFRFRIIVPFFFLLILQRQTDYTSFCRSYYTGGLAEWDFDLQKNELDSIENIDMSDLGFSENNISLFDFMQNDDFSSTGDKTTFGFTLEFDAEYKPYFDSYVKKTGKSHLADIVKNEVLENA